MSAHFCYERGTRGWTPVVYHGEKPPKNKYIERSPFHDVPAECFDTSGAVMFAKLTAMFPEPPQPVT